MPGTPWASFVGGYGRSQSPILNCETLQNQYVQIASSMGAKSPAALYPSPGFEVFGNVTQVEGKRFFSTAASQSRVFSVTGQVLYEWFSDGSTINRGAVAIDANPATICWNGEGGQQLAITAGDNFYILDLLTNVLTQVAALNGTATMAGFAGGYFLVFDIATGTIYQSDLYDGLVFGPANFYQRSVQADDWISSFVTSWGQVLNFGTKTRDTYFNSGTFPLPFAPSQVGTQQEGCAAPFSVCEAGKSVCWLGTTGQGGYKVYATSGYEAQELSDEPITFALSQFTETEIFNATGESWSDQGHDFYNLYVGDTCFGFSLTNFAKGAPHTFTLRSFTSAVSGVLGAWRARWHCFGFSKHLWLDALTGYAYHADILFPLDVDGLLIQRQRTSPALCFGMQELDIGEFELIMQVGLGNTVAPGDVPLISLSMSFDGGITWGRERVAEVGREGQSLIRVRWQSNGSGRQVAFRLTMTDPVVNWRIIGAVLQVFGETGQQISLAKAA